ncbi:TadE/TadG family type IV pilus assembly protein [Rhodovulum strictum]|nr:TadE/TadG family type IV pilus assembly protein [Rhodovulum strictum]
MSIVPKTCGAPAGRGWRGALNRRLARFRRDEDGGLIAFSLFILVAMLLTAGLAIDFMRYESTRSRLQNTMDRAVLAAASLSQTQDAEAVVRDYFEKAGLADYLGPISVDEEKAAGITSYRKVRVTAGATLRPIFLSFIGMEEMPVITSSSAEEGISDLEISMVLDVSGSMAWAAASGNTRIHDLKEAAKDFVYHMQCNPNASRASAKSCEVEHGKVSISIVPYSEQVNAGPLLLSQFNVTNEHSSSYCVDFSEDDYSEVSMGNYVTDPLSALIPAPQDILRRTGHFDPWKSYSSTPSSWTCDVKSGRWIAPLIDSHLAAYTVIDGLVAEGNTSIDVGMKWGTALLDPGLRLPVTTLTATPVAAGSPKTVIDPKLAGRPYNYGQSYNMKAVVLMTDGVNTDQHYLKDQYRSGPSEVWHYRNPDGTPGDPVYSVYNPGTKKYRWVNKNGSTFKTGDFDNVYVGDAETCSYQTVTYYDPWWRLRTRQELVCTPLPVGTPYQLTFPEVWATFTTRWYSRFAWLSNPLLAHGNATKNARLQEICNAAKKQNILVYTIGFEVGKDSEEERVLRSCATTVNHFFLADGLNLSDTFGAIASSLNQLRLTE